MAKLIPVTKWPEHHDWPTVGGLRWLIFNEDKNGLRDAIVRAGGRVLVDEERFFEWTREQNKKSKRSAA